MFINLLFCRYIWIAVIWNKLLMILKKIPLLIILCIASSILIILFYLFSFNFFATPPKTSKELLEEHLKTDNISSEDSVGEDGLVSAILTPKLSYFQFQLSFSANFKNDKNIMNTEIALSTFEGEFYMARIKHHEPALRRVILDTIAETPEEDARTKIGKERLAKKLLNEINAKLENLSEDPLIEGVHFTAFAIR